MNVQRKPRPTPASGLSRPVFYETALLQSLVAHRITDRVLHKAIRSLFATSVIMPIIADEKASRALIESIEKTLKASHVFLGRRKSMFEKLIEDRAIKRKPVYTNPREIAVEITSPLAFSFLELVKLTDEITVLLDTCWFGGALDETQVKEARWQLQGHMVTMGMKLIGFERRARAAALRQGKSEEATKVAGPETEDIHALPENDHPIEDPEVTRVDVSAPGQSDDHATEADSSLEAFEVQAMEDGTI